jgi:hypothetical protein
MMPFDDVNIWCFMMPVDDGKVWCFTMPFDDAEVIDVLQCPLMMQQYDVF